MRPVRYKINSVLLTHITFQLSRLPVRRVDEAAGRREGAALPGVEERAALIERYAAWPVDTSIVEEIARGTDGLSAAHIREVCYAAALASADAPAGFADALRRQVGRVLHQHRRARSYDFGLGVRKAGFA